MKVKSWKVTIVSSRLNSKPITNYCFADSEQEATKRVCAWHSVDYTDQQTNVKAEVHNES